VAVVGDSAGANMAAAVTLLSKQRRGPKISFQLLFYPVTDAKFRYRLLQGVSGRSSITSAAYARMPSPIGSLVALSKRQRGPWLTRLATEWFWNAYLPDHAARSAIIATPLSATLDQLKGLPDALVITAENDVLRDEAEAYARRLWKAGVRVTSTRYLGTIHDFVMLNAIADTPAARGAIAQANAALRSALE
jgi:acetyl esterase